MLAPKAVIGFLAGRGRVGLQCLVIAKKLHHHFSSGCTSDFRGICLGHMVLKFCILVSTPALDRSRLNQAQSDHVSVPGGTVPPILENPTRKPSYHKCLDCTTANHVPKCGSARKASKARALRQMAFAGLGLARLLICTWIACRPIVLASKASGKGDPIDCGTSGPLLRFLNRVWCLAVVVRAVILGLCLVLVSRNCSLLDKNPSTQLCWHLCLLLLRYGARAHASTAPFSKQKLKNAGTARRKACVWIG